MKIIVVIDTVPSNYAHAEYRLEGEVLRRLRDVNGCCLADFLATILDHVDKRGTLLEQAIKQQTSRPTGWYVGLMSIRQRPFLNYLQTCS